jgi:hypothetical protein
VPDRQQGVASGIVSTASGIGAVVGLAVLVIIANLETAGLRDELLRVATAEGIARVAYTIACGVMLMLIIMIGFRARSGGQTGMPSVSAGEAASTAGTCSDATRARFILSLGHRGALRHPWASGRAPANCRGSFFQWPGALKQRRPAKEAPGRQGRINKLTGKVSAVTRNTDTSHFCGTCHRLPAMKAPGRRRPGVS